MYTSFFFMSDSLGLTKFSYFFNRWGNTPNGGGRIINKNCTISLLHYVTLLLRFQNPYTKMLNFAFFLAGRLRKIGFSRVIFFQGLVYLKNDC